MKHQRISLSIAVASVMSAAAFAPAAYAIDVTAGDWKLSIDGNVNAHYIYSRCDTSPATIAGGLACVDTDSSSSSVSNGLLPAALSHDIGSDSQRPFAIVIVGGLISDLLLSIVLLPTFYVWIAKDGDQLPEPEAAFEN